MRQEDAVYHYISDVVKLEMFIMEHHGHLTFIARMAYPQHITEFFNINILGIY